MIRAFATVIGLIAFAVGAAGLVSRYLPVSNEAVLVVISRGGAAGAPDPS